MTAIVHTVAEMRAAHRDWIRAGERVAFVPTMGNLHDGHVSLVDEAHRHGKRVVASIFVNPTQFGANEDFSTYPHTPEADLARLDAAGTDLLFAPSVAEMYPHGHSALTEVRVPGLSSMLCGASRPVHFTGVATVVTKLFNIVQPDVAVFGMKDYQQLAVIRRMSAELSSPVEIVGAPTVREDDGLAMSSRNGYLDAAERRVAPTLYRLLQATRDALVGGDGDHAALEAAAVAELEAAGFRPDYYSVRRAADLEPAAPGDRELVVLAAAWLGRARLIDNIEATRG